MKLTAAERLILHNQYEILSQIDAHSEDYRLLQKCLEEGYEEDFDQLLPHFEPPQEPRIREEVRNILEMFRSLTPAYGGGQPPARFVGFDGNEETEHYAYARFLLEDRGLWRESKTDEFNTHYPVLEDYLAMVAEWKKATNILRLTPDEVMQIVAKAPILSLRNK